MKFEVGKKYLYKPKHVLTCVYVGKTLVVMSDDNGGSEYSINLYKAELYYTEYLNVESVLKDYEYNRDKYYTPYTIEIIEKMYNIIKINVDKLK